MARLNLNVDEGIPELLVKLAGGKRKMGDYISDLIRREAEGAPVREVLANYGQRLSEVEIKLNSVLPAEAAEMRRYADREERIEQLEDDQKAARQSGRSLDEASAAELKQLRAERRKEDKADAESLKVTLAAQQTAVIEAFTNAQVVWCYPPFEGYTATYFLTYEEAAGFFGDIENVYPTPRPALDSVKFEGESIEGLTFDVPPKLQAK